MKLVLISVGIPALGLRHARRIKRLMGWQYTDLSPLVNDIGRRL